jgi:hypothetical protein
MTSPVPTPAPLPEPLLHKLLAVRLQLEAYDREVVIAQLTARNATLERESLHRQLPPLVEQAREALHAPAGASFNWQTFTFDATEASEASRVPESPP